jgi:hypothetical protein
MRSQVRKHPIKVFTDRCPIKLSTDFIIVILMRLQEAGSAPPQESGLLYNSWTGKHHSEMR